MTTYVVAVTCSAAVLVFIIELLRRRQLREKYAALWLLLGLGMLVLVVFPGLLTGIADLVGVTVPVNLLFFIALLTLLAVAVHLSWELSRVEEETRTLAEEIAILRLEVEDLRASRSGGRGHTPSPGPDPA